jgi:hypothetical protein
VRSTSYEAPHYVVFLQPPVASSLFGPNILLNTLFSHAVCVPPLMSETKFHTHTEHRQNYSFVYSNFYVSRQQMRRRKVLDWMVASITRIQSPLQIHTIELLLRLILKLIIGFVQWLVFIEGIVLLLVHYSVIVLIIGEGLIVVSKYLNNLKHLVPIFISWFCPAFWWRDSNIYLVFSVFASTPTSLLAVCYDSYLNS